MGVGVTWSFTDLPRGAGSRPLDRLDGPPCPSRAASPGRTVIKFDFRDPAKRYWMVLEPSEVSVCLQHPGFDIDLEVKADTATLYRVYLGRAELGAAMRKLNADDDRAARAPARFGRWFAWSAFAPAQPPGRRAPEGGVDSRTPRVRVERPLPPYPRSSA